MVTPTSLVHRGERPVAVFHHQAVLLKVRPATVLDRGGIQEASWCCWRARLDRLQQTELVIVSVSCVCRAVFEHCQWSRCRNRPGRMQFTGFEADEALANEYVGRALPAAQRGQAVVQYVGPGWL